MGLAEDDGRGRQSLGQSSTEEREGGRKEGEEVGKERRREEGEEVGKEGRREEGEEAEGGRGGGG